MTFSWLAVVIALALALGIGLAIWMPRAMLTVGGRLLLLAALLAIPALVGSVGVSHSLESSKKKDFCTSCHEMEVYETSLQIDDPEYLPAVHFQNRYVPRETACYTCHTDYTLYGDVEAKLNGLKHVWVHFVGDVPAAGKLELYKPYPNDNCLQCHRGARKFEKRPAHNRDGVTIGLLYANEKSCVSSGCHNKIHDISGLGGHELWGDAKYPVSPELKGTNEAPADPFADDPAPVAEDPFAEDPAPAKGAPP